MAERRTSKVIEVHPEGHDKAGTPTGRVIFTFADDTSEAFDLNEVPDATKLRLMLHGASQKIGDSYAQAAGTTDPLAFSKAAVVDMIKQLYAGEWRGTVEGAPRVNELAVAISRATGESLEDAVALVAELDDAGKKEWRSKAKVKLELAKIAGEKAAAKIAAAQKAADEEAAKEAAAAPTA